MEEFSSSANADRKHRYFVIHKPYGMVSQFSSPDKVVLLDALGFSFPEGTHAVGRLDKESEGLLLLTTDKKITRLLFRDVNPHKRVYLVQVKNIPGIEDIELLKSGLSLKGKRGEYFVTMPAHIKIVEQPSSFLHAEPAYGKRVTSSWIQITIYEGKYHQVRKMVAAIHHRCLRLIRVAIEDIELGELQPGGVREIPAADFFKKLNICY